MKGLTGIASRQATMMKSLMYFRVIKKRNCPGILRDTEG